MKLHNKIQNREEYFQTQIKRSQVKYGYSKVSVNDTLRYIRLIKKYNRLENLKNTLTPLICMGTRNGREADLFRFSLNHSMISRLIKLTEKTKKGIHSKMDFLMSYSRSNIDSINANSIVGLEINPQGKRKDIWEGSFDDLPKSWESKFSVIFSNSFDHSQDPIRTAKEWIRIAKKNAILIFCFRVVTETSLTDPVGDINLNDVTDLFPGELLYYKNRGSCVNYSEVIIRLKKI